MRVNRLQMFFKMSDFVQKSEDRVSEFPTLVSPSVPPSITISICQTVLPSNLPSVCLSLHLSFPCPSICLSICLFIHLSLFLFLSLCIRHSICISLFSGSSFHSLHIYIPLYNSSFTPPSAPPFALIIAHSSYRELRIAWYYNFMNIFFTVKNFQFFLYCILEITNFCNLKK